MATPPNPEDSLCFREVARLLRVPCKLRPSEVPYVEPKGTCALGKTSVGMGSRPIFNLVSSLVNLPYEL